MANPENTARNPDSRLALPATAGRRATVAIAFVRGMLAGMIHAGRETDALLNRAHIAPLLLLDSAARIPVDRYAELYNLVIQALDDEGFGLFSQPLRAGTFEFLCRSVLTAPVLATAIDRAIRFLRLVLPELVIKLAIANDQASLSIAESGRYLPVGRVFAFEWLLRLLHGLFSWLVGRSIILDSVAFPYPKPDHADDYVLIYTAQSTFDADCLTTIFAANLLELPIRRDEAALQAFLEGAPGRLTMLYRRDREMVLRVRRILRDALPNALSLVDVADVLHLSPRTLHRRISNEGSSFQAIKDALRRDLAINHLAKTTRPISVIASDLGFADTAAFYRAFVRWTALAPAHYRRRLQQLVGRGDGRRDEPG